MLQTHITVCDTSDTEPKLRAQGIKVIFKQFYFVSKKYQHS